jgi:tetratricopeptide (TPR) repeat protein
MDPRRRHDGHLRWLLGAVLAVAGLACAHPAQHRAEEAWGAGDLLESERLLESAARIGTRRSRAAAQARLEEVRSERLSAIRALIAAAGVVAEAESARPVDLLAWYDAAWRISRPGDPSFELLRDTRAQVETRHKGRLGEYRRAEAELMRWARPCDTRTPHAAFEKLLALAEAAGEPPPVGFILELSEACFKAGRYIRAGLLVDRAAALDGATHRMPPDPAALTRLALGHRRTGRMHRLMAAARRYEEIEEVEAQPPAPVVAARPAQRRASPDTAAEVERSGGPGAEVVQSVLGRVRSLHARGEVHAALVRLDEAIADLGGHRDHGRLQRQREAWQGDRQRLVRGYLEAAEAALASHRSEDAAVLYDRILELEPGHAVATDRLRRIDNLRSLRDRRD